MTNQMTTYAPGELQQTIEYVTPIVNRELERGNFEGGLIIRNSVHREKTKHDPKRSPGRLQFEIKHIIVYSHSTPETPELQHTTKSWREIPMVKNQIKAKLESKMGSVTFEELEFAIEQFEVNCDIAKQPRKLQDATFYDMLATNVDFHRHNKSLFSKTSK